MSGRDIALRRRAIATGLRPYLDDSALAQALHYWEQHYIDQPRLALQRYVADICRDMALDNKRADILRNLLRAMTLPSHELIAESSPNASDTGDQDQRQAAQAFSILVNLLMAQLDKGSQNQIRLDFLAAVRANPLPPALLDDIQRWLSSRHSLRIAPAPIETLRELLNQFYVLLCQLLGPVQADHFLAQAVSHLQRQEPTLTASVNRLL